MSKAAWGGLRLGWIRANPRLVRELAAVRADVDMASPVLEQLLALELLARWEEVVDSRGRAPARAPRRAAGGARRARAGVDGAPARRRPERVGPPAAPVATRLASAAARERSRGHPRPPSSVDGTFERHLRLPFTAAPDVLRDAVRTLAALAPRLGADVEPPAEVPGPAV